MKAAWEREKEVVAEIREAREELERLQPEIEAAERAADYARAAELQYGKTPRARRSSSTSSEERLRELRASGLAAAQGRGRRRRHRRGRQPLDRHPRHRA